MGGLVETGLGVALGATVALVAGVMFVVATGVTTGVQEAGEIGGVSGFELFR